jgi:hypothetical protein
MKNKTYRYKLIQDGIVVAYVECSDDEKAQKDINHYALMYSQDGPVKIVKVK